VITAAGSRTQIRRRIPEDFEMDFWIVVRGIDLGYMRSQKRGGPLKPPIQGQRDWPPSMLTIYRLVHQFRVATGRYPSDPSELFECSVTRAAAEKGAALADLQE